VAKPIVKVIAATLAGTLLGCGERWMSVTGAVRRATTPVMQTQGPSNIPAPVVESDPPVSAVAETPLNPVHQTPSNSRNPSPSAPHIDSVIEKQAPAEKSAPNEKPASPPAKNELPPLPVKDPALSGASAQERTSADDGLAATNVTESPGPLAGIEAPKKNIAKDIFSPDKPPANGKHVLKPGDQLEITYSESWSVGRDYLLLPGDDIRVELLNSGDATAGGRSAGIDRTVRIQPDGKISLPYIGVVDAANHNVAELAKSLGDQYRTMYVDPEVLVTLVSTGELLRDIRAAFRTAGNRTTQVTDSGMVTLPQLGAFKAAGLKLTEVQDEINERYKRALPGFGVMVRLVNP